ncbi:hypothetical protein SAMN05660653_02744 [Desulfonatronum thiosulfatophilum]|uniref:PIN domain-containing protein n=1 Tax=Desulfonatronum thiosulfatophilum TaxID=617002 RepID=A0A1G6EDX0_9BACT|nr:PIN domain nuclease [Desulfonatronum thiosulfatophilum]SDB55145.1 hypothetical protein SAMN05660653_02744 [Desulfonatronum thiosulfatophilum]
MILVDTSVLVDWLRGMNNKAGEQFDHIINSDQPFGICSIVCQELLQGSKNRQEFELLKNYLQTQRFFHPLHPIGSYIEAANIYFACRRKGLTLRSTVDCLIAQIALENDLLLLHNDRDFEFISQVTDLRCY